VVRLQTALGQQLFDVAERERVPKIPADCAENDFGRRLPPLEDRRSSYIPHRLFRLPAPLAKVATHPSYEYWGDSSGADQVIHRGDVSSNSFSVWWLHQQQVVAAFTMNRPDEERDVAPKWIESGQRVSSIKLKDVSQPIVTASVSAAA
jgi:hypothetical protein